MKIKNKLFNRLLEPSITKLLYISWNNYIFYSLSNFGVINFSYDDFILEFCFDKSKLDSLVINNNLDSFEKYCSLIDIGLKEFQK